MVFVFLIGLITGIFLRPLFFLILTKFVFTKTTFVARKLRPFKLCVSERQKIFFTEALKFTKDLAWTNLIIQRWFEIAKDNFHFLEKMKYLIMKKFSFALKQKLIKELKINRLVFRDCPYINEIKCLTKKEFEELVYKMGLQEESSDEDQREEQNDFDHLLILAKTEFNGKVIVNLTAILPGNLVYDIEISLVSFQGDIVARIPSKNHMTRFDAAFISDPNFEIYFKDEEKDLKIRTIKKIFMYTLNKNVIYPTWNSFFLPLIVPSLKNIDHPIYKINFNNFSTISDEIEKTIRIYSCLDYKILKKHDYFIKRRGQYYINEKHRIFKYDISLTKDFSLSSFFDFSFFEDIFSTFVTLKKVKKLDDKTSLVILYFIDASYQYIRIKVENGIIFQGLTTSDFIYFEIKGSVLLVLQFSTNKNMEFTDTRVKRIIRKLMDKQSKLLGSAKLHSFLSLGKEKANTYFKKQLIYPEKCKISIKQPELRILFEKIKEKDRSEYFVNELSIENPKILTDSFIRLQLFEGEFVAQTEKENNVYSTILANKNEDFIVNTLEEEETIIDFDSKEKKIFFYEINDNKLTIFSKEKISQASFYKFTTLLKFYNKYYSLESKERFEEFSWAEILEIPFEGKKGSISLEFFNKAETQIQLSIHNKDANYFLLKKMLIPNSTNFKFIFPSISQKYTFTFKTSAKYDQWSKIRIRQLGENVYFLSCNLFLPPKKELKIPVFPSKDDILHWKIPSNLQINTFLKKDDHFVELSSHGLLSTDNQEYLFCYKNNSTGNATFNVWIGYTKIEN